SAKADAFSSSKLRVQCGVVTGILCKYRFAAGPQKKCIRMEERWCTPEEFVGMDDDISFGSWDSDIRANGVPLKELIKKCQFLLLKIWCQDESVLFAEDPTVQILNYGRCIKKPMWLKRIKEKLQQKQYETVGGFKKDIGLIFKNFQEFNKGKEIVEEGRKLQEKFEKSFQEVFLIKPPESAAQ
ncbi:hypothetical protein lerEdw1_007963, partial [Lerista edwardsae]